jgi:5-methyltetrahydrofolate--homocysteine methyltransferase
VTDLARVAPAFVSTYPNAGLPNELGGYDHTPEHMAGILGDLARRGLLNVTGGCCGTTPAHVRAIAEAVRGWRPGCHRSRSIAAGSPGLEPLVLFPGSNFVNVGERTNVTGSRRFARLVKEGQLEEALAVARDQVENGAQLIDVNMDEGLLDSEQAMGTFLNLVATEPDIAKVPVMVDSSKWSVIEAGLRVVQGKAS